jgi:hypothetical protein
LGTYYRHRLGHRKCRYLWGGGCGGMSFVIGDVTDGKAIIVALFGKLGVGGLVFCLLAVLGVLY